jgi:hypothetical protein
MRLKKQRKVFLNFCLNDDMCDLKDLLDFLKIVI